MVQVNRVMAIKYVMRRWPYFNRTLALRRPSHILTTHAEDVGFVSCARRRGWRLSVRRRICVGLLQRTSAFLLAPSIRRPLTRLGSRPAPVSADNGMFEEFRQTRPTPLKPGETILDVLPPTLANTIIMTQNGLQFGAARLGDVRLRNNRTDWCGGCSSCPCGFVAQTR